MKFSAVVQSVGERRENAFVLYEKKNNKLCAKRDSSSLDIPYF